MTLQERVNAIPNWYHRIELPGGIVTPGPLPEENIAPLYRFPEDMTGQRVLDVGTWDGYWAFESLKRGAKEVVAIDDFSDNLGQDIPRKEIAWLGFDLCREALGYTKERCSHQDISLYDIREEGLGRFDTILFYGTLYHCRYPMLALDILRSICDKEIRIETAISNDVSIYRGGFGHGFGSQLVTEFYPGDEYGQNHTNWWGPTLHLAAQWVGAAGFRIESAWKLCLIPQRLIECRGFITGVVR